MERCIVQSTGEIETFCEPSRDRECERAFVYFRAVAEVTPPFKLRVRSPGGSVIVERVLRELPEGAGFGSPSVDFLATVPGEYRLEIWQMRGTPQGQDSFPRRAPCSKLPPQSVPSRPQARPDAVPCGAAILRVI
jgi:hypothetical protein